MRLSCRFRSQFSVSAMSIFRQCSHQLLIFFTFHLPIQKSHFFFENSELLIKAVKSWLDKTFISVT